MKKMTIVQKADAILAAVNDSTNTKESGADASWRWSDQSHDGYVKECATLGDTLIQKAGSWEGEDGDCAYVTLACRMAPDLARSVKILTAQLKRLEKTLASYEDDHRHMSEELSCRRAQDTDRAAITKR